MKQGYPAPASRVCYGRRIVHTQGDVADPAALLSAGGDAAVLSWPAGRPRPRVVIDLGPAAPGGYPVFRVRAFRGEPVLRVAYADWYDYIVDETYGDTGDFLRGCCKYLGVELPVLPANPNRFELYGIRRAGDYAYPLIQGQQRFVLLTLDTEDTAVELEWFTIRYTGGMDRPAGAFRSGHEGLDRLWNASVYTVQTAVVDNSHGWDIVGGRLALRALTKGRDLGWYPAGRGWTDYTFTFDAEIAVNPHGASGIGWAVRVCGPDSGYVFRLNLDGTLQAFIREGGQNRECRPRLRLGMPVHDNRPYRIATRVDGDRITIGIDGVSVLAMTDETYARGSVGFCQTVEKWAFVNRLRVEADGAALLEDDFTGTLDCYDFTRSDRFIADGAKRDRLPWSGDLDWAGRNLYYGFADTGAMADTLRMLARHQLPDGYIWGVVYPENDRPPAAGDYGMYESDIFSAWFVPSLADYLLFTGDRETAAELYPHARACLDYLWQYVEGDGLFYQRYQTSKGLWDHALNDIGKYAYSNVVIHDAFAEGAYLARELGLPGDEAHFLGIAARMKRGILDRLWHGDGYLRKSLADGDLCFQSTSMALATGLLPEAAADAAVDACRRWLADGNFVGGKVLSVFIRGCFQQGRDDVAYALLTGSTGAIDFLGDCAVNWIDAVADDKGPATTTESMVYGKNRSSYGVAWADLAHPDTAVAHLLSGFILGIQPTDTGFCRFEFHPHPCGLEKAAGVVPTPYGDIRADWEIRDGRLVAELACPPGTTPRVVMDERWRDSAVVNIRTDNPPAAVRQAREA